MYTYDQIFSNKQRLLFVTAHPDDLVIFFGALIHRLRADGKDVYVLLVTNGARGSRENEIAESELAKHRLAEEKKCLKVLGVDAENLICLGYADGEVESNMKLIGEISKNIRKFKVDLVATHEPSLQYQATYAKDGFFVQHRDHRKIGEAVIDAVYPFSRDRSFFPEHYVEGIEPHEVFDILLTDEKDCNFDFDYSTNVELKKEAMRAHKSQFDEATIEYIINAFKIDGKYLEKFNYVKLFW
ncbi:MAG: PIG-L deacetylase family protein [Microgenomates group bacterium]